MTQQPEFLTNDDGQTVADGIIWLLNSYRMAEDKKVGLAISTAYINPEGFNLVADQLNRVDNVKLLLGADPDVSTSKLRPLSQHLTELEHGRITKALEGQIRTMEEDRNLLGFTYQNDKSAQRMIEWLQSGKVQVRRYEKGFLHGKAWIIATPTAAVIAGSSNFTHAGLSTNKELNLGQYQPNVVQQVRDWYDKIWDDSNDFDLAALFASRYEEHSPYLIYLRMLWERYRGELETDDSSTNEINLTGFQKHGVARARRILNKYKGVLIADGVGLGKSFIAAELMREAIIDRRQRVLLVAPAALRDGPWKTFQNRHARFHFECVSYEQLRDDLNREPHERRHIQRDPNDYAMVIIDEAHGFRNPDSDRAESLRKLLQGSPPKKLVLMTATPINNTIWDLYYELNYFIKSDSTFATLGIKSLREHFQTIATKNSEDLSPNDLFDILDEVAVRRTRNFIKNQYPGDTVDLYGDGNPQTIKFPQPVVQRSEYNLNGVLPGLFDELEQALDASIRDTGTFRVPDEQVGTALSLARYIPSSYLKNPRLKSEEAQISGLLLSGLLKRFESSATAFSKTCARMATAHGAFLQALDKGLVLTGDDLIELVNTDTDDIDEYMDQLEQSGDRVSASHFDITALKEAVTADKALLEKWANLTGAVKPEDDPKLKSLAQALDQIARLAKSEAVDEQNKRKTLIFSYYADTAKWIHDYLINATQTDPNLKPFQGRIALASGGDDRDRAAQDFAPISTESPRNQDRYDILVATDVLAEGVNLQQARNIINYDLPWNPMRLVQRHGRIDRIGSPHDRVYLRCFFPDEQLDRLLGLEHRLKAKLAAASAGVGVENEILPGAQTIEVNFAENRAEIEKLRLENPELFETGGEKGSALSGEEYRRHLQTGLEDSDLAQRVKNLAWGSGSGKAVLVGNEPGYIFCARIGNHPQPLFRFVSYRDPNNPRVISDTLECLAHAYAKPNATRVLDETTYNRAYDAWALAKADIYDKWLYLTHPKNIQPQIPKAMRDAIQILRDTPPLNTPQTELQQTIASLESDYGVRVRRRVRDAINSATDGRQQAAAIITTCREIGLEPATPPRPLQPITPADIHLICWLATTT